MAVLAIGALAVFLFLRNKEERQWAAKIHDAVARRDLALAKETIDDQERTLPRLNEASDVKASKREFDVLKSQFDGDDAKLREVLGGMAESRRNGEAARKAEEDAAADPAATKSLDMLHNSASELEELLARVQKLPDMGWVDPHKSLSAAISDLKAMRIDLQERYEQGVLAPDAGSRCQSGSGGSCIRRPGI